MVKTDAIEGIIDDRLRFHYDIIADVLYIRRFSAESSSTYSDLTDAGDIVLRDEKSNKAIGLTVVSWWKRFGQGPLPDSISAIQKYIEPVAKMVAT